MNDKEDFSLAAFKRLIAIEEKYNELIMAVESKVRSETRHETALRYIKDREFSVSFPRVDP